MGGSSSDYNLGYVFHPTSVALVGISGSPANMMRSMFLDPLLEFGFEGNVYLVHPSGGELWGFTVYPSIKDIPEPVDYVITSIPATHTIQLMRDCVTKGVKAISLFTAGFSETGEEEGIRLENELASIAREGGVRIIGPNCMGIYCPSTRLSFDPGFSKESGGVSFISQSGGNSWRVVRMAEAQGVRFNKVISYGNACDINETELIDYLADDPETKVIAAYIEGIRGGRGFFQVLGRAARAKPVIILKGGRTGAGARAVASHTGSLAGAEAVWDSVFHQTGAIRVYSVEELVNVVVSFSFMPLPRGRNVGILGLGGGESVQSADDCEAAGLSVPALPQEIRDELRGFTPLAGCSVRNPVDSSMVMSPEDYSKTVRLVSGWSGIDLMLAYVVIDLLPSSVVKPDMVNMMVGSVVEASKASAKPMAVVFSPGASAGQQGVENLRRFHLAGLPVYHNVSGAARAISKYIQYHERIRPE